MSQSDRGCNSSGWDYWRKNVLTEKRFHCQKKNPGSIWDICLLCHKVGLLPNIYLLRNSITQSCQHLMASFGSIDRNCAQLVHLEMTFGWRRIMSFRLPSLSNPDFYFLPPNGVQKVWCVSEHVIVRLDSWCAIGKVKQNIYTQTHIHI